MKTREAALRDFRRTACSGAEGFLFQRPHGGWDWASKNSPMGLACQEALAGNGVGMLRDERGGTMLGFDQKPITVQNVVCVRA